jgi:hypothetical protein
MLPFSWHAPRRSPPLASRLATAAFDPRVTFLRCDPQQSPEDDWIAHVLELALLHVPHRAPIVRIKPDAAGSGFLPVLGVADADPLPATVLEPRPRDHDVGIGRKILHPSSCANGRSGGLGRFFLPNMCSSSRGQFTAMALTGSTPGASRSAILPPCSTLGPWKRP